MGTKTRPVDLLAEIDKIWHDLLRQQVALDQYHQHQAVVRLSAVATELKGFVANRVGEDVRRDREDAKILKALAEARRLSELAEKMLAELDGRKSQGQKRQKPIEAKTAKKKAKTIKVNLAPLDAIILETALRIAGEDRSQWEAYRDHALQFLQTCFPGNQIPFVGFRNLSLASYLEKDLFRKALVRIIERYQAWLNDKDLLTNKRTEKLFKLVQEKIGSPGMLQAMFEVMLDQSLTEVQAIGAEDQKTD